MPTETSPIWSWGCAPRNPYIGARPLTEAPVAPWSKRVFGAVTRVGSSMRWPIRSACGWECRMPAHVDDHDVGRAGLAPDPLGDRLDRGVASVGGVGDAASDLRDAGHRLGDRQRLVHVLLVELVPLLAREQAEADQHHRQQDGHLRDEDLAAQLAGRAAPGTGSHSSDCGRLPRPRQGFAPASNTHKTPSYAANAGCARNSDVTPGPGLRSSCLEQVGHRTATSGYANGKDGCHGRA